MDDLHLIDSRPSLIRRRSSDSRLALLSSDFIPQRPSTSPPPEPADLASAESSNDVSLELGGSAGVGSFKVSHEDEQHIITVHSSDSEASLPSPLPPIPQTLPDRPSSPLNLPTRLLDAKATPNVARKHLATNVLLTPPDSSSKLPPTEALKRPLVTSPASQRRDDAEETDASASRDCADAIAEKLPALKVDDHDVQEQSEDGTHADDEGRDNGNQAALTSERPTGLSYVFFVFAQYSLGS